MTGRTTDDWNDDKDVDDEGEEEVDEVETE